MSTSSRPHETKQPIQYQRTCVSFKQGIQVSNTDTGASDTESR